MRNNQTFVYTWKKSKVVKIKWKHKTGKGLELSVRAKQLVILGFFKQKNQLAKGYPFFSLSPMQIFDSM